VYVKGQLKFASVEAASAEAIAAVLLRGLPKVGPNQGSAIDNGYHQQWLSLSTFIFYVLPSDRVDQLTEVLLHAPAVGHWLAS
jgi:hypothetical protein